MLAGRSAAVFLTGTLLVLVLLVGRVGKGLGELADLVKKDVAIVSTFVLKLRCTDVCERHKLNSKIELRQ